MNTPRSILSGLVAAAALLLLAGCAVVTVDVDAYKGPLANTEEIQGEQAIAMAMGAKPLLVQLRDHLEVKGLARPRNTAGPHATSVPGADDVDRALRELRRNPNYEPGHMRVEHGSGGHVFRNELAIRVNEILGLYEDAGDPSVAAMVREAEGIVNDYKRTHEILEPASNAEELRVWREWKRYVREDGDSPLVKGYDEFFAVQRGRAKSGSGQNWRSETWPMNPVLRSNLYPDSARSNHTVRFRSFREDVVKRDATALFGEGSSISPEARNARAAFVEAATHIADSYFDSRYALRRMLRLGLVAIVELHAKFPMSEPADRPLLKVLAKDTAALIDWVDLRQMARETDQAASLRAKAAFGSGLSESLRAEYSLVDKSARSSKRLLEPRLRKRVSEALEAKSESAAWLLAEDERLATNEDLTPFGLGRGPTTDDDSIHGLLPGSSEIIDLVGALAGASGALDRGRPPQGIETLIERFLAAARLVPDPYKRASIPEGQELMSALVAFGQKVAQLGNSVVLLRSMERSDEKSYVTVLQSVGNSILVQIDELKQQGAHRRKHDQWSGNVAETLSRHDGASGTILNRWDREKFDAKDAVLQLELMLRAEYIAALKRGEGGGTLTNVTSGQVTLKPDAAATGSLSNTKPEVQGSLTVTLPGLSGTVGMTNVTTTPSPAEKIARAIEAVTEMRSGMIYLRPASAYLRSSYPASLSGHASSQRSENMLERQALKQIPIFGRYFGDGVKEGDMKAYIALDKQAWQSINRVKVAGGGRVNYVIAKDDVGNWYVKQYSTDRTAVFNAMRNVAMFSAGNAFGGPLPLRQKDGTVLIRTNPVLEVQFQKARAMYGETVTNTFAELAGGGSGAKTLLSDALMKAKLSKAEATTNLVAGAQAALDALGEAATRASDALTKAEAAKRIEVAGAQILALTEAWSTFGSEAASGMDKARATDATKDLAKQAITDADVDTAKQAVRALALAQIEPRLAKVREALHGFQQSIDVIKTGAD